MERLRVGLIGVGGIARLHYQGYKDNPQAELHAVCDVNHELLQRRVREWGVPKAYTDYRELLADPTVDAVEVITPHHLQNKYAVVRCCCRNQFIHSLGSYLYGCLKAESGIRSR